MGGKDKEVKAYSLDICKKGFPPLCVVISPSL